MAELPDFPRATHVWIGFLQSALGEIPVSNKILGAPTFVRIVRLPGTARNIVLDEPVMSVQCYDSDDDKAEQLATRVRGIIWRVGRGGELFDGVSCKGITEYSGPYEDPDEEHESSRFSWSFAAALRATQ